MQKWLKYEFSSGPIIGDDFKLFAKDFKETIKNKIPKDAKIIKYNVNHYFISGFIKRNGKYAYFSTADVRHFTDEWYNNILIRTAKDLEDYTGGSNNFTSLDNFGEIINFVL